MRAMNAEPRWATTVAGMNPATRPRGRTAAIEQHADPA